MRFFTLSFLLVFSLSINGQDFGSNFSSGLTTCPYDPSEAVGLPSNWEVYQTLDNTWDGVRDSSRCFTFIEGSFSFTSSFDLSQIDPDKALFCRLILPEERPLLASNSVYRTTTWFETEEDFVVLDTCQNDFCSGYMIRYTIPNEEGNGTNTRIIKDNFTDDSYNYNEACWSTDNLDGIQLQEVIMKFTFNTIPTNNGIIDFYSFYGEVNYDAEPVYAFTFSENLLQDTAYVGSIAETAFILSENYHYQPLFVQQTSEFYPSFDHYTYVEAVPDFSTTEQETFILEYEYGENLIFQPFTGIRGGLVDGSDTLRHHVIFDFMLPIMCQELFIVDLIVPGNTTFRFASGELDFAQARSCFMFMDGGRLEVKKDEKFHYGKNGIGVLALARDGHIFLNENSELIIDNNLLLNAFSGSENEKTYVHLAPGSRLVFDEHAKLYRSHGDQIFLYVYMNGGEIDDSHLSEEERSLIRRIYPSSNIVVKQGELAFSPNPLNQEEALVILDKECPEQLPYQLIDMTGRVLDSGILVPAYENKSKYWPPVHLPSGIYTLRVNQDGKWASGQLVIQRE